MMGGLGNLPLKRLQKQRDDLIDRYERLGPDSRLYDQQRDELLEAIDEVERQIRELDPPPPPPPVEAFDLDDPAARKAALAKWGAPHLGAVPDLPPGTHAMTGTGGHLPGGGGFDFDEFDRAVSEGVAEAEDVPEWLRYASPTTVEQSEPWDLVGESAHTIRDAVGSYVANVAGFDWEDMETVEEMADQIVGDVLGREAGEPLREDSINDRVWTEIFQAAEHAGFEYDLGEFLPFESGAAEPSASAGFDPPFMNPQTDLEALTLALWLGITAPTEDGAAEAVEYAETLARSLSPQQVEEAQRAAQQALEPYYEAWDREDREERAAQWEDPRPHSDDEFSHESRAVNLPSGLPGFQSPSASPGSPGFQAPPVRERPGGFRTPAVGAKPGGFQGAPPSVQSMLTHMASGEPGRIGRSHPEGPTPPYEPAPPLTEEERKRGKEAIEKIRRDNPNIVNPESTMDAAFLPGMFAQAAEQESQGYFGGVGDIVESVFEAVPDIDPRTAAAVAMAVAAAIAAGTGVGGPLVPPLLAGGAMLSSQ